jgi:hypothetical protein
VAIRAGGSSYKNTAERRWLAENANGWKETTCPNCQAPVYVRKLESHLKYCKVGLPIFTR